MISSSRSQLRRRTDAERRAIDARAAAFPRPLSAKQHEALALAAEGDLVPTRAGWGLPYEHRTKRHWLRDYGTATMQALIKRGLVKLRHRRTRKAKMVISIQGRALLRRYGRPS